MKRRDTSASEGACLLQLQLASTAMTTKAEPLTRTILHSYYRTVRGLHEYISHLIGQPPDNRDALIHETDTLRYRDLLYETLVTSHDCIEFGQLQLSSPVGHLREVCG